MHENFENNQDFLVPAEDNYYPEKQITQMALGQNQSPVINSNKASSVQHQVQQVRETPPVQTNIQPAQKVVVQERVPVPKVVKFTEPLPVRPKIMTLFTINKETVKPEVGTEPDIRPQAEKLLMSKKIKEKDEKQIQGNNCVKENTSTVDDQITRLKDNSDSPSCESLNLSSDLPYHKFQIEKDNIITEPVDLPYHKLQIEKDNRITRLELNKPAAQEQLTHSVVSAHIKRQALDVIVQPESQPSLSDCPVKEPVILPEFVGLILCFQFPKFIATADLKSAFLIVGLHQTDREFTKFQRVKDPSDLPLIEKTKVSHTVLPEKLFPKQVLDEKAHGAKKRLEKSKESTQENLAGHGITLILISLTFIINVSCDHKDQIVVCREEQTIKRKKIPPDIPFKAFKSINKTLINRNFISIYFILIISIITLIISFKLKFLSTLASFIPIILFNFLRSGEGVRDPNHKVSPDPTRIFQKICLNKVIGDSPPEGDILLLKSEQSLVLFQSYVKKLGKSPKKIFELQKKERHQFGRIGTPFIKSETKTPKWLGGGILAEDGPIISFLPAQRSLSSFLPAQRSLSQRLVARSIQPFSVVAVEPIFIKRHTLCLFPNPSRLFSVFPYPITTSFTSEQRERVYFGKLGKPDTIEDFDFMSEWLDSGSDIVSTTKESVWKFKEKKTSENTSKSEKIMEIDKRPEQQQPQFNSILNPQPAPNKVDHQKSEQQTMEQQNLQQQNIGLETGKDNALWGNKEKTSEKLDFEFMLQRKHRKEYERSTRRKAEVNPTEIESNETLSSGPKPPTIPAAVLLSQVYFRAPVPSSSKPSHYGRKRPWPYSNDQIISKVTPYFFIRSGCRKEPHVRPVSLGMRDGIKLNNGNQSEEEDNLKSR
uniref:Uncharacterized protein n=1 Tax=Meloidogyne enterolobii TaxID=390850 RepID=A0A6V7WM34_MELEN|nr:unnamed protein product [Meloidogyne enterolobii]